MDIQSVFQVIYLVLFILAGVFFAAAVFLFFYLKIPSVYAALRGRTIVKKKAAAARRKNKAVENHAAQTAASPQRSAEETMPLAYAMNASEGTAVLQQSPFSEQTLPLACGTAPLGRGDQPQSVRTSELGEDTGTHKQPLQPEIAKRKLGFQPDVCVLVFSADERII